MSLWGRSRRGQTGKLRSIIKSNGDQSGCPPFRVKKLREEQETGNRRGHQEREKQVAGGGIAPGRAPPSGDALGGFRRVIPSLINKWHGGCSCLLPLSSFFLLLPPAPATLFSARFDHFLVKKTKTKNEPKVANDRYERHPAAPPRSRLVLPPSFWGRPGGPYSGQRPNSVAG